MNLAPEACVMVTLDIEQERLAADIRDGHRLFYGVAGSGKTLILLSRAKSLASRLIGNRVLILCFNITLAAYLRSLIHDESQNPIYSERIEVAPREFPDKDGQPSLENSSGPIDSRVVQGCPSLSRNVVALHPAQEVKACYH